MDKHERDLEEENHKLKHTHEDIEKIKQKHEENLQKKQSQAKEIEEREKTIRDKMTRINELKKKTQELEKFKFVLDYKIKELKRDIGPREEEISKMKEQIANMRSEIDHFGRTNNNMWLIVKDLASKRNGMEKETNSLNETEVSNLSYIKSFEYDVSEVYENCLKVPLDLCLGLQAAQGQSSGPVSEIRAGGRSQEDGRDRPAEGVHQGAGSPGVDGEGAKGEV